MRHSFYDDPVYKAKQSAGTKILWEKHKYQHLIKPLPKKICQNSFCHKIFIDKDSDRKIYCSRSCAASVNNHKRTHSFATRLKISLALKGNDNPNKESHRIPKLPIVCQNLKCKKQFFVLPYLAKRRKYCSNQCAMAVIGGKTTSPKASKGKPGIRLDIDTKICFYSTWEANFARVLNLLKIKWLYAPKRFNLDKHTYRPDFYLPEDNKFIEIKNFMGQYSLERDRLFRQKYPQITLEVISSKEYKEIENQYKPIIETWE